MTMQSIDPFGDVFAEAIKHYDAWRIESDRGRTDKTEDQIVYDVRAQFIGRLREEGIEIIYLAEQKAAQAKYAFVEAAVLRLLRKNDTYSGTEDLVRYASELYDAINEEIKDPGVYAK